MKKIIMTGISMILLLVILFIGTGCQQRADANVTVVPEPDADLNPITGEPYQDIPDKRGVTTNITEFNELLRRASKINAYSYRLTDTDKGIEEEQFMIYGRFVQRTLPEVQTHDTGEIYDEIMMDRLTKIAFSHCSHEVCEAPELDKELEKVDYNEYYVYDPLEYLYRATKPVYAKEEMVGQQYTKVFNVEYEGKEARIWIQEYYGFPLKIVVRNDDDSKRTIKFEDIMVDATRRAEVELPFNFTVKGETGNWIFWDHYNKEWPKDGRTLDEVKTTLGV